MGFVQEVNGTILDFLTVEESKLAFHFMVYLW